MDNYYEAARRIMLATNKMDGVYYLFGKRLGVNENTLAFFYALSDEKPHSQKEISDEWIIPRTTINSIVKTMLVDGYIVFCAEPHKKEKRIILTEKGRQYANGLLSQIYTAEKKAIKRTLEKYSHEFISALEDFSENLYQEYMEE